MKTGDYSPISASWISADDVNRLVREIDVALNGVDAAPQASLCDIAAQVSKAAREFGPILGAISAPPKPAGAHSDDWAIAAAFREVTGPNGGLIKNDEVVDFISTRAREMIANARPASAVPLTDRDVGGKIVREAWVRWALAQSDAKPSWLVPYDDLSEADKEADRQIFEACAAHAAGGGGAVLDAALRGIGLPTVSAALAYSRNYAEATPHLTQTGKDHILGLCNMLEIAAPLHQPPAEPSGKCSWCGALASTGAFIPDGRWVCSHDCHLMLIRAEGQGLVLKTPEGWQVARTDYGGIRVSDAHGSWVNMHPDTSQPGRTTLEMRLLYGLAEALLAAAPTQHQSGQDQPTAESDEHAARRLCQLIGKASFAHAADKQSAMELVTRLVAQPAVAVAQDGILIWIETLAREGLAAGSEGGRVQALKKIVLVAKESAAGNNAVNIPDATSEGTDNQTVSGTTAALIDMLRQRDATGLIKHGKTLDRTDLSQAEWLQHLAEEMLDGAGYALAAIRTIKNKGT